MEPTAEETIQHMWGGAADHVLLQYLHWLPGQSFLADYQIWLAAEFGLLLGF